jgi:glycosyltransferase involved in cell wall biosynthesis
MNILLLNVAIGRAWGGMESHSDLLAAILFKKGHNVIMGCSHEHSVKLSGGIDLPSEKIWIANSGDVRAIAKIAATAVRRKSDIIIANAGREYWPAVLAAKMAGTKVIFIRHQVDRLKKITCWLINRHVEQVIAVSRAVKDALADSGVSPAKIDIIYNAIDLDRFNPDTVRREDARKEFSIGDNDFVIGTAGKLNSGKGIFDLLHAGDVLKQKYPVLRLVFVGEGPERPKLELEAKRLSLHDKVIFTGPRKDMERMYAAMDIFALPSHDEGLPTVVIEAMAMAKPVIATSVGGIPEIVENEVTGILVPPHDAAALADAISRYIDDRQFAGRIAAEGRKLVERKFSDKAMGDNFERVIMQVSGGKSLNALG